MCLKKSSFYWIRFYLFNLLGVYLLIALPKIRSFIRACLIVLPFVLSATLFQIPTSDITFHSNIFYEGQERTVTGCQCPSVEIQLFHAYSTIFHFVRNPQSVLFYERFNWQSKHSPLFQFHQSCSRMISWEWCDRAHIHRMELNVFSL